MINDVTVTNHLGESITIELRNPEKSGFFIRGGIDGLGPPKANINSTEIITSDGSIFNSARVNARNIVFHIGFLETATESIEDLRQKTYKYFPIKKLLHLLIETDNRICEVYGRVESNEQEIFTKGAGTVISIICEDAYLYSLEKQITIFSGVESIFTFPFSNESVSQKLIIFGNVLNKTEESVYYTGDADIGVVIYVHALGIVVNPKITNTKTREIMEINTTKLAELTGSGIVAGDDIVISSVRGNLFISLWRGGVEYNIQNCLDKNADWFTVQRGDNLFAYTADSGVTNLQFRIENQIIYEGV